MASVYKMYLKEAAETHPAPMSSMGSGVRWNGQTDQAKLCKSEQRARIAFFNNVALDGESERY